MTQDFAKKPRSKPRRRKAPKSTVPAWVWLFTGAVLGAFIMFLTYLSGIAPTHNAITEIATKETKKKTQGETAVPKPHFDFYQLLKESEVVVNTQPLEKKKGPKKGGLEFMIQVGSFDSLTRADRMRAELILLNLEASIETRHIRGKTAYRVMVGPFLSNATLDQARGILLSNNFEALTTKRKIEG